MRHALVATLAVACAVLSGCSILDPPPVAYEYYVLDALAEAGLGPETETQELEEGTPVVSVGRVGFPDYLRREALATRTAEHQIEYSSSERWAEPLEQAFERVLRQELAAQLSGHGIAVQATKFVSRPDYLVQVDVRRFERVNNSEAALAARWAVRSNGDVLFADELTLRHPLAAPTSEAATSALSATVARLAAVISEQLQRLVRDRSQRAVVQQEAPPRD